MSIRAVAFDVDGTLYPNFRFYLRIAPFTIRHLRVMLALGRVRDELRRRRPGPQLFYREQARLLSREVGIPPEDAVRFMEKRVYRGWEPMFAKVRPHAHLRETLTILRSRGLKLGVLSDFPAVNKLRYLKLDGYWDVVLCSEEVGYLKPAPEPFQALAAALRTAPNEILYVGNNYGYDVQGARSAGLMSAIISPKWRRAREADFAFRDYRELRNFVLKELD